MVKRMNKRTK